MLSFNEDLLHYVWKLQYYNFSDLLTTDGDPVHIIHPGYHNYNSGPDFSEGKIKLNGIQWNGNIEIHIKSSDWVKHNHSSDHAYDNVILHVVYEEDEKIVRNDGSLIPCIELKGRIPGKIFRNYYRLQGEQQWIPCEKMISDIPEITKSLWMDTLIVDRLEHKSKEIIQLLEFTNYNWEYCLFIQLGKYFGAKVNTVGFEQTCKSISLDKINKNRHDPFILESLFHGQAGFLQSNFEEEYPKALKKEYAYIQHKYRLEPLSAGVWKFFRLRPTSFPTIRMDQFSAFNLKNQGLFSYIMEAKEIQDLYNLFDLEIPDYWEDHYVFDKVSDRQSKNMGKDFQNVIIMNAILPFIFVYGQSRKESIYSEFAVELMGQLPAENNKIIRTWTKLGIIPSNAVESQALLQLKNKYCSQNRCLQCAIGHQLMK